MLMIYGLKLDGADAFEAYTKIGEEKLSIRGMFDVSLRYGDMWVEIDEIEIDLLDNNKSWTEIGRTVVDFEELADAILVRFESRQDEENDVFHHQRNGRKIE